LPAQALLRVSSTDRLNWLIRLRWVGTLGVVVTAALTAAHQWIPSPWPLVWIAILMAMANLCFQLVANIPAGDNPQEHDRGNDQILALQIFVDLCTLTLLLHWSGGVENPFAIFYVFHMATSAIAFRLKRALMFGLLAVVLFGGTVLLEAARIIPHYPLLLGQEHSGNETWHSAIFITGYLTAFSMALFGVISFVGKVERRRVDAEHHANERELLALSRERLARVGELSAGVAHSVRNPLHGAMNCLSLIRLGPAGEDPDSQEALDLLSEGLSRIEVVTQRLLTYSGNRKLNRTLTDVNQLIQDSVTFIDPRLTRAQVTVHLNLGKIPEVMIDRDKIGEIIINLMDNAVFACKEDGKVTVNTCVPAQPKNRVLIEVIDTGVGIAPEHLRTVFDPLFTTKAVGEGSGLGLAIARRVVEEHGGDITISSNLGEFTIIQVLLPLNPDLTQSETEQ
jgi:signal transduction histidine kinase